MESPAVVFLLPNVPVHPVRRCSVMHSILFYLILCVHRVVSSSSCKALLCSPFCRDLCYAVCVLCVCCVLSMSDLIFDI